MRNILIILTLAVFVSGSEIGAYDSLWTILLSRHSATLRYYDESALPTKARREQLATGQTLSGGPTFSGSAGGLSDGEFLLGHRIDWTHPRWSSSLFLQNSNEKMETGSVQLMYALLSDLDGRLEDLDTVIALVKEKAELQREVVIYNDFRMILANKIQYDYLKSELEIRLGIKEQGETFLSELNKLVKAGIVPRNSTQSIQLFLKDNELRAKALNLECELTIDNVFYNYEIDETIFLAIDIPFLLEELNLSTAVEYPDYIWRMDSLNMEIQEASLKEQNRNQWRLSVGAGTAFQDYSSPEDYNNSLLVQFSMNFHKKVLPEDRPLIKRKAEPRSNEILSDLKLYHEDAKEYSESATQWIESTLKRIKLGERGIMYELSQNLDIIINNQLKYFTLRTNYYRRELAQFRSLRQLSEQMRPRL